LFIRFSNNGSIYEAMCIQMRRKVFVGNLNCILREYARIA